MYNKVPVDDRIDGTNHTDAEKKNNAFIKAKLAAYVKSQARSYYEPNPSEKTLLRALSFLFSEVQTSTGSLFFLAVFLLGSHAPDYLFSLEHGAAALWALEVLTHGFN